MQDVFQHLMIVQHLQFKDVELFKHWLKQLVELYFKMILLKDTKDLLHLFQDNQFLLLHIQPTTVQNALQILLLHQDNQYHLHHNQLIHVVVIVLQSPNVDHIQFTTMRDYNVKCPSTCCDCTVFAIQRCGTIPTLIGTTCTFVMLLFLFLLLLLMLQLLMLILMLLLLLVQLMLLVLLVSHL